jgi:hypothetical protein
MANEFLSPYQTSKVLSGVIEALPKVRSNFLQTTLASGYTTSLKDTINFDKEFAVKNVSAMFVDSKADVTPIQLGDFGTTELYFAYSKEGYDEDEWETINQRALGQDFGNVNPLANAAANLIKKAVIAEERFENLFEKTWAEIAMYGGYEAYSQKHPRVRYNFGRTVATTAAFTTADLVSSVNLTTTAVTSPWGVATLPVVPSSGGYTAGQKAWTTALVTAGTAKPVEDLNKMYMTMSRNGSQPQYFIMQSDAYLAFNFDVNTNYKDAAVTTINSLATVSREILPTLREIDGLTFRRSWTFTNGVTVPIYTYDIKLNDRDTGTEAAVIGDGWVIGVPNAMYGKKIHGRIKHPKAGYAALPRFINRWGGPDTKNGLWEYEIHCCFILGHTKMDSLVAWKVC